MFQFIFLEAWANEQIQTSVSRNTSQSLREDLLFAPMPAPYEGLAYPLQSGLCSSVIPSSAEKCTLSMLYRHLAGVQTTLTSCIIDSNLKLVL